MDIVFDRGSKEEPKGHALLYFRSRSSLEEIWVTYTVILPITVDVTKYVPPFLMNQVGELGPKELSAFAFPPAPEQLESYETLKEMASQRDDDILFAGTLDPADVASGMMMVNEAVQQYAAMYTEVTEAATAVERDEESSGLGVSEVLYGLMSESDKLGELTKLVGKLKFAVDGSNPGDISEAEEDIGVLAQHLPPNHQVAQLIEAVKSTGERSADLADLYLQRCFHLVQEEYGKLGQVEEKIKDLEAGHTSE